MCMFCRSLLVLLYFFFWLAIVLSVLLRYTDSDYPFRYLQTLLKFLCQNNKSFVLLTCKHHFWTYTSNLTTVIKSVLKFMINFNFKIINFPNMCSNIPASPAYGVYISQLIRYARASSNYSDFLKRHLHLRNRLLDQGYKKIRLIRSLKKFIFRYQDLVEIYSVSAEKIINDGFSYSENA